MIDQSVHFPRKIISKSRHYSLRHTCSTGGIRTVDEFIVVVGDGITSRSIASISSDDELSLNCRERRIRFRAADGSEDI